MFNRFTAGLFAAALTLGAAGGALAQMQKLIPAEALARIAPTAHLIDIRPVWGKASYASGHIPGSVSAPYSLWRGPKENPGQPLTDEALTMLLRAKGVDFDTPTVVIFQGADPTDFGAAARVYWTLKSAGVKEIAILDGGLNAWFAAGLPLTQTATPPEPTAITAKLSTEWLASRDDVKAISEGAAAGTLVDARPPAFLKGEKKHPAAKAAGTVAGATQFTHNTWFAGGSPQVGDTQPLLAKYRKPEGEGPVVSFCNTGHWAATNWFMMSEIQGIEGVKLYPESMVGWTGAGMPVVAK